MGFFSKCELIFKKDSYAWSILIIVLLCIAELLFIFAFNGVFTEPDSPQYLESVDYILGNSKEYNELRMAKPFSILIPALFGVFFGSSAGMIITNIIFLFIASILMFFFTEMIFHNTKISLFSALLFLSSLPVLHFSVSYLTDIGSWAIIILLLMFVIRCFSSGKVDAIRSAGLGFIIGLGMLYKETVFPVLLFFVFMIVFCSACQGLKISRKRAIYFIVLFSVSAFIPLVVSHLITYSVFGLNFGVSSNFLERFLYIWFAVNKSGGFRLIFAFLSAFTIMVLFFFIGTARVFRDKSKNPCMFWVLASIFLSFLMLILFYRRWVDRLLFLLFPIVIPLSAYGLVVFSDYLVKAKKSNRMLRLMLGCVILIIIFLVNNLLSLVYADSKIVSAIHVILFNSVN